MCKKVITLYTFLHVSYDTYLHTFWSNSTATFNSVLTHIANRCDTIRDWIRNASFTIWKRSDDRDAHLRSHFLRIMTRFLSRNKINTSGWARRLSLEKMIAQWKRERMENECCSRPSFLFLFFFVYVHHRTLSIEIIPLLGSRLSKMIRRLRSNTNFHAWVSHSVCFVAERNVIFRTSTFAIFVTSIPYCVIFFS